MEWLALDARLEQKKKAKIRKQQRELKKKQQEQEAREQQLRKLAQRCAEMQREERLSIAMEQFYKDEAERKRLEMKREENMKIFREVANARKRAQELGLPVSTPGLAGLERLRELETRIAEKEDALQRAAMAKQRLDALPKKKLMLKKVMGRYFASSLQKKVERAVYHQECDHLLSLFDPESHTSGNRAEVLLSHESKNGFTPVLAAIFCKKLSILRRLLEIGASPNFETSWGMTPLLGSIMTDDIVALSILMEFKVELNYEAKRGMRALHVAADKGRLELLKVLLRGGADVNATNAQGRSPLMQAVVSNHLEAARILVAFGADKLVRDQSGMAALDWATKLKLPHMVSFLSSSVSSSSLFAQISEEEEGDSTVKTASSAGNAAHQRRTKLLESAMRDRDLRRLRQLLEDPSFSPNYEDSSGNTPFSVVCEVGSCDDILFCLDRKAVPTHQNRSGINALMVACYRGETDMLELLISAGCNLLTRDYKGWDCYRYLNKHDHPDVVETLTRKYREVKSEASPSFLLGNPLLSTEELRKDFTAPLRSVQGFKESTNEPEVGNDTETRSRRSTRPTEATVGGCSDESDRTSNESGDESLSDPAQDPDIRKWAARQQVLKHNRRRRSDFEHERERILLATKRGRRNGLIAPLPGDSGGRKKFPSCENCKRRRARKRCLECEQALCDECHARLHELAHRRHHRFDELEPQLYIGHELKEVIQERQATSLGHFVEKSKECVASMRSLLQSGSEHQPAKTADSAKVDPEVERFEWKQRLAREKEVMQTQINVPAAAAQHAARAGEGEIFVNPAEIDLANLYIVQKKYEKAKELLLQTQKLVGESIGVLHPTMLKVSIGLAKIYQETGDSDSSVQTIQNSLGVFESILPPDHRDMLLALSVQLAGLDSQARYDEAVRVCRHWFEVRKLSLDPDRISSPDILCQLDEFVAKRETICMSKEDQIYLEMKERNAQQTEQQLRDKERRVMEFRHLLLDDPVGLAELLGFARPEFAEDLINFWIAVEGYKKDGLDPKGFRAMAVHIFLTYIRSRRIKVITAVQRKKIKKTITTPGKKLPVSIYDEVQKVVFDVVFNGVYARYLASNNSTNP